MIKFGTDGWRAVIAEDFTFENVRNLSQAIADYLKGKVKGKKKIVVGYDRRFLSKEFAETVSLVLAANNIKVVLSNRDVPTPTVSYHCVLDKYNLGVMITASHNSAKFNGLKIKTPEGGSADKDITEAVESYLYKNKPKVMSLEAARAKGLLEINDLTQEYVKFFKGFVDLKKIKKLKLKVLVEDMYGTGDDFVERILGVSRVKI
ncbi:MAG: phosphoglucomutase/phosphomannomutase family protein, partial [Candidatus Omnitrophica bacterium]|nr:phosphoglucomutase/phosphomannomutase family protein [Candidatus Omnitrophota bacterium]